MPSSPERLQLRRRRDDPGLADYDARERIAKDRAEAEVAAARAFVERARRLLSA